MTDNESLRRLICEIGRRMYAKNLVAASDGNISVRLDEGQFLCTPSGVSKGFMQPTDLIVADGQGEKIGGTGKVTSEFPTHLACYEERPDIHAVVHAHPPHAIAFTLTGISLSEAVLPEVVAAFGGVPTSAYATPGTPEGNDVIRPLIRECDAAMLARHGSITVGRNVEEAYFKLEKLEHAAQTLYYARQLGALRTLSADQVDRCLAGRQAYGAIGPVYTADLYPDKTD
ncbi:MAG: class II aldolase/adducin family protein [Candidatus Hydrogenedentes bacterium]|nr:class II aldolase/adducin family protein [Candidatus Hydrogenedentota bacterium]